MYNNSFWCKDFFVIGNDNELDVMPQFERNYLRLHKKLNGIFSKQKHDIYFLNIGNYQEENMTEEFQKELLEFLSKTSFRSNVIIDDFNLLFKLVPYHQLMGFFKHHPPLILTFIGQSRSQMEYAIQGSKRLIEENAL